jgi:hypothetical protein
MTPKRSSKTAARQHLTSWSTRTTIPSLWSELSLESTEVIYFRFTSHSWFLCL